MSNEYLDGILRKTREREKAAREEQNAAIDWSWLPDRCPTCRMSWSLFPPAKIQDMNLANTGQVRCVECKAVLEPPDRRSTIGAGTEAVATEWELNVDRPFTRMSEGNGDPEWKQVEALFAHHGLPSPPWRLRDELVGWLDWARYGQKIDDAALAASPPATPDRAKGDDINSWRNSMQNAWRVEHPGLEYADLHREWWGSEFTKPYEPTPEWSRACVQAVIAALMQEGVIAWNGDAVSIVSQMIAAQGALSSDMRPVEGWQPIETAPKDGSTIWVATHGALCVSYWTHGAWRNWFKGCNYGTPEPIEAFLPDFIWFEPTHWQPLPSPPKPSKGGV